MNSENKKNAGRQDGVDKSLIAMCLKMSVEERLAANDDAALTIRELRDAFQRSERRTEPHS